VRRAIVVGGGLAGAAAAAGLAARGASVTLLERHGGLAAEASGNAQGVLYARLSPHGTALSLLLADGLSFSARLLRARLPADGHAWSPCGVLQLPEDEADARRQAQLAAQAWPPGFLRAVDPAEAQQLVGVGVDRGGLWFGEAGWVHPPALCRALADSPRIRVVACTEALEFEALAGAGWRVRAAGDSLLEADTLVLANAADARAFAATGWLPLHAIRGQITQVPATAPSRELRAVLCAESYVAPAREGWHCAGASFVIRDTDTAVRAGEQAANLRRLAALSPAFAAAAGIDALDPAALPGRAALRCVSPDYLPLAGALPDATRFRLRYAALSKDASTTFDGEAPWLPGLFVTLAHGSRGLVTAPLAGELVASLAFGEPLPVPAGVMRALAPARFLARALARRRG
jgi:tRNA 5-methylaminomethyl-2-thiouridine biosynthesis bifunctional protein